MHQNSKNRPEPELEIQVDVDLEQGVVVEQHLAAAVVVLSKPHVFLITLR